LANLKNAASKLAESENRGHGRDGGFPPPPHSSVHAELPHTLITSLARAGIDVLFEQNGARITDFRRGEKLGARDHIVRWTKPKTRPEWMTLEQYQEFPDELRVHLLAYNLIHLLMAQAAGNAGVEPRTLSFKHTVQLRTEWNARAMSANDELFTLIARVKVGNRPNRIEPRERKRRPKPFPWLKTSRQITRDNVRRFGHPQGPQSKCHSA
jgi:hypothetical protein